MLIRKLFHQPDADPAIARTSASLARYVLPMALLTFACNGDPSANNDEETSGDGDPDTGDGDPDTGDGDPDTGDGDPTTGDGDPALEELRSEEPHDEFPQLEPGEAEIIAAANHHLTLDLYHSLREGDAAGEGFSISAYSISSAFGMLYAGSVDPARGQIAQTLHFALEGEQQHVAHNWLDAELTSRNLPEDEWEGGAVVVQSANGLWMLSDYASGVSSDFLDLLSIHYDTGMKLANFSGQPEAEREAINGWVSERTHGLIPQLFPPDSIHEFTTMVLVNALYMKAPWAQPFSTGLTQPDDFTLLDNQVISVDMMRSPMLSGARYGTTAEYQAVSLPLRDYKLDVVVILPEDFSAFEADLDADKLGEVLGGLGPALLDLRMPKLQLAAAFNLTDNLEALGMVAPFTDATSFDAIHSELNVIETVVHNTIVKWDEDGVEAAAATGIAGDGDGDGDLPEPIVVRVDRPFLMAIRDRPTNTLLFFGRVLDPNG